MKIHPTAKIFPGSHIIGNVKIGQNSSVWYNAVIRGDIESIIIGNFSNVQDNCVVHSSREYPVELGDYVSIGHGAVVHGCKLGENVLVGMNATILNGAEIGENSIIGAGAVVTEGKKFPPESLIIGLPAKAVRTLSEEQIKSIKDNALRYVELSKNTR
ncbi:MAG: gamma carbonic anhydrase family protein [Methanobacteriaceae archaeon]|nr:gamma carbonic anhydrase family protein [Methanobacteriaceae archaeon]MDP2836917.1 gamma carbonic anhydrase family protein [Methanobacteriaceae archaeon]MDP3483967.1 gamma carbonic anhydrase family protein [Methanobacteriaceae archaeon]MDP3623252.1 gamma carbonic anhydrase family protein [Methanobacteriaceae archaeon]